MLVTPLQETNITIDIIKLILSALGIVGVILSIYFGFKSQTKAIKNQWQQEFYKQKMSVYLQVAEVASKIAYLKKQNPVNTELLKKSHFEFYTLYGGPIAILEGTDVERAMVLFEEGLNKDINNLSNLALYLSHILRNESRSTFTDEKKSTSTYGNNRELLIKMGNLVR